MQDVAFLQRCNASLVAAFGLDDGAKTFITAWFAAADVADVLIVSIPTLELSIFLEPPETSPITIPVGSASFIICTLLSTAGTFGSSCIPRLTIS